MTEFKQGDVFKPGDRVVGHGYFSGARYVGIVDRAGDEPGRWKLKDVDSKLSEGEAVSPVVERVTLFEPAPSSLAFVGKRPEPVEAPKLVLPFAVDPDDSNYVVDADGNFVGDIGGSRTSSDEDAELAALVVKLLNAHFGAE